MVLERISPNLPSFLCVKLDSKYVTFENRIRCIKCDRTVHLKGPIHHKLNCTVSLCKKKTAQKTELNVL